MLDSLATPPEFIDLAIVGAGPHALTLVTHLLQKKKSMRGRFLVFDPTGTWMNRWHHQFAAFEIPHLRSPAVHQPDPDPHALRTFAESRPHDLFAPYDLPGTQLFRDFCQETIRRWQLEDCVYPAQVVRVEPCQDSGRARFCLHLSNGQTIIARRVVIANGGAVPNLPEWVGQIPTNYPQDRLLHSHHHPLLHDVLAAHPIECVNGLPVIDEHLRWQGCELFIMGGLAALRVGPAARNLSGAKAASDRIVPALTKSTISR
jgi:cation diffusion facilitator CzcD-associated flavoprotein CzcO